MVQEEKEVIATKSLHQSIPEGVQVQGHLQDQVVHLQGQDLALAHIQDHHQDQVGQDHQGQGQVLDLDHGQELELNQNLH